MKDAYSFDLNYEARAPPTTACSSPICAPSRGMGLKAIPMRADTGPIGGDLSHEFIILADTGESQVFCHKDSSTCRFPPARTSTSSDDLEDRRHRRRVDDALCRDRRDARRGRLGGDFRRDALSARGIEVGHIFYFGTKYSKPMGAKVQGPGRQGAFRSHMGSYGIGPTRLVAAIIEASHDEAGIIWPESGRAVRRRHHQHEGRRCRLRPRLRGTLRKALCIRRPARRAL
jgi:prolyl-tRNA synthetase